MVAVRWTVFEQRSCGFHGLPEFPRQRFQYRAEGPQRNPLDLLFCPTSRAPTSSHPVDGIRVFLDALAAKNRPLFRPGGFVSARTIS